MIADRKHERRASNQNERLDQPMEITWTPERIRALGPTTNLPTLASILRCSKWKAYQMARTGQWETTGIKIIRVGSTYKVAVPSILEVLGYAQTGSPARNPGELSIG